MEFKNSDNYKKLVSATRTFKNLKRRPGNVQKINSLISIIFNLESNIMREFKLDFNMLNSAVVTEVYK